MPKHETKVDGSRRADAPVVSRAERGVPARRALAPTVFCPSSDVDRCVRRLRRQGDSR